MKVMTFRLGQFAVSALFLTVLFRYVLHLCIGTGESIEPILCSVVYFGLMFLLGWHFGGKDEAENEIHDIGFRFHFTTYLLCIGIGYVAPYMGWNAENFKVTSIIAACWGIGLLVHFIFFLIAQKETIKGYNKEEIFQ